MPKDLQDAIQSIKDIPDLNPKQEKAIALVENIAGLAGLFTEHVKLRYPKKKRIFRKRDRTTKKFKHKVNARKLFLNSMQIRMSLMQNEMIRAQPLPKTPKSWNDEHKAVEVNGGAYVIEHGEEITINRSRSQYGNYQNDSFAPMVHGYKQRQKDCDHIYVPVEERGNLTGPWKARCQKCGYEP